MTNVQQLFCIAIEGDTKNERRSAFRELRQIAVRGEGEEAEEAREALHNSAQYAKKLDRRSN